MKGSRSPANRSGVQFLLGATVDSLAVLESEGHAAIGADRGVIQQR